MKIINLYKKFSLLIFLLLVAIDLIVSLITFNSEYNKRYDENFKKAVTELSGKKLEGNQRYSTSTIAKKATAYANDKTFNEASEEASSSLFTYIGILIVVGVILSLVLPIITNISNPVVFIRPVIGLVIIGLVFLIAYLNASSDVATNLIAEESTVKLGDALILTSIIVIGLGLVATLASEVVKMIKNN